MCRNETGSQDCIQHCCDALEEITLILEQMDAEDDESSKEKHSGVCVTPSHSPPKVDTTDSVVVMVVDLDQSYSVPVGPVHLI